VNHKNQYQPAGDPSEEGDSSFRERQCIPGQDPSDINKGRMFIFLNYEANTIMHKNKRKVRYVFEGEEEEEEKQGAKCVMKDDKVKSASPQARQDDSLQCSSGESGHTPELWEEEKQSK